MRQKVARCKRSFQKGFTMIELSVLLVVASFVAVNVMTTGEDISLLAKNKRTHEKLEKIEKSLGSYANAFGYYPCPANPRINITNQTFGTAPGTNNTVTGCNGVNVRSADSGSDEIYIGVVPVRELGLNIDDMIDAWGNRIVYAVARNVTAIDTSLNTPSIIILNDYDNSVVTTPKPLNQPIANIDTSEAAYVLISYGRDGVGAYPKDGACTTCLPIQPADISGSSQYVDSEFQQMNHHIYSTSTQEDRVFLKPGAPLGDQYTTVHFDDILVWGNAFQDASAFATALGYTALDRYMNGIELANGNFVAVGYTENFGAVNTDALISVFNPDGAHLWTRVVGGNDEEKFYDVVEVTLDNNIVVAGYTFSNGTGGDALLMKFDVSNGNLLWDSTIGGAGEEKFWTVVQDPATNNIIAAGHSDTAWTTSGGNDDAFVVLFDSNGVEQWNYHHGGIGEDQFRDMFIATNDGNLVIASIERQLLRLDITSGVVLGAIPANSQELNPAGTIPLGKFYSIIELSDGTYVAGGFTDSVGSGGEDGLIVKLDNAFNVQWSKTLGGASDERFLKLSALPNGGFIAGGRTQSAGAGSWDAFLVKFDDAGDEIWTRTFGGAADDRFLNVEITSRNGIVGFGYTDSKGAGNDDALLVKLSPSGTIPSCSSLQGQIFGSSSDHAQTAVNFTQTSAAEAIAEDTSWTPTNVTAAVTITNACL